MTEELRYQYSAFRFSEEDRACLLRAWPRENDHEKAKALIDAMEPRVGVWLAMSQPGPTLGEIKKGLMVAETAARRLRNVLQKHHVELSGGLNPTLLDERGSREAYPRAIEIMEKASGEQQMGGRDFIDTINPLLDFFLAAAGKEIDILKDRTTRGPKGQGAWLVCMAAKLYQIIFQSSPSKFSDNDNPSNFQKFISELVTILRKCPGYEDLVIGESPYNQGISCDCFLPPAAGFHISTP